MRAVRRFETMRRRWPRSWRVENYVQRWLLCRTPWGGVIYLHHFTGGDASEIEHTHAFAMLSLIFRGGYSETRYDRVHHRRWFNWMPKYTPHCVAGGEAWTIAITGPIDLEAWGFIVGGEWTPAGLTDHQKRVALLLEDE